MMSTVHINGSIVVDVSKIGLFEYLLAKCEQNRPFQDNVHIFFEENPRFVQTNMDIDLDLS